MGRKVGRMRELLDIKQETLAAELGITQQAVSKLEQAKGLMMKGLNKWLRY